MLCCASAGSLPLRRAHGGRSPRDRECTLNLSLIAQLGPCSPVHTSADPLRPTAQRCALPVLHLPDAVWPQVHSLGQRPTSRLEARQPARQRRLRTQDMRLWVGEGIRDGPRAVSSAGHGAMVRTGGADYVHPLRRDRASKAGAGGFMTEYVATRWYRAPEIM